MFKGRSLSQATSKPKVITSVSVPPAQPQPDNREQLILLIAVQCSAWNKFAGPEFEKILPLPKSVCGYFHVSPSSGCNSVALGVSPWFQVMLKGDRSNFLRAVPCWRQCWLSSTRNPCWILCGTLRRCYRALCLTGWEMWRHFWIWVSTRNIWLPAEAVYMAAQAYFPFLMNV